MCRPYSRELECLGDLVHELGASARAGLITARVAGMRFKDALGRYGEDVAARHLSAAGLRQ